MPNLFLALRSYAPTAGRDAKEDFLTAAFHWLLCENPGLSAAYARALLTQADRLDLAHAADLSAIRWDTQQHITGDQGAGRPDLVGVVPDGPVFVCEHKLWAELHDGQMATYAAAGDATWPDRAITVLVTARRSQHTQPADVAGTWAEVYALAADWAATHPNQARMVDDFLELVRDLGAGPAAPVSHAALRSYLPSRRVETRLDRLLNSITGDIDPAVTSPLFDLAGLPPARLTFRKRRWGRVGLTVSERSAHWVPGFYFGVMLDGTDHKVTPSQPALGPDFVGILSLQANHPDYGTFTASPEYKALRDRLATNSGDWDFLDHLGTAPNPNPWHPLHLRRPLSELLRGTMTAEDQRDRLVAAITDLAALWLSGGELAALRERFEA